MKHTVNWVIALILFAGVLFSQDVYYWTIKLATAAEFSTAAKAQFRDAAIFINSSADGQLDIDADGLVQVGSPTVDLASTVVDTNSFTTTATADTVVISGATAADFYVVAGNGGSVDQQDVLQWEAKADTLIVHRLAAGASGLVYSYIRFR